MTGIESIAAERQRQIDVEDWTPEHDDEHDDGCLAQAAACYAAPIQLLVDGSGVIVQPIEHEEFLPLGWPESWDTDWWKPKDRRHDLVRAGALIAAEIDRLDRLASKSS